MTGYGNRLSFVESMKRINVLTSLAGIAFGFFGLVMTGLLSEIVELVNTHAMVPLVGSLVSLLVIWASSSTRDPSWYHPAELSIVGTTVALMLVHTFWTPLQNFVAQNNPVTGVVVFLLMLTAGAILMR